MTRETIALELQGATVGYDSLAPLLTKVSATLHIGELAALLGRNGSGKSTLLKHIAGLLPLIAGSVKCLGQPLQEISIAKRAQLISFVSPARTQVPHLTAYDLVALGRAPYTGHFGKLREKDHQMVATALKEVGMHSFAHRKVNRISDGEYQRIMIARALAQDTPIILLDEPTAFLDLPNRYELALLLHRLAHHPEYPKLILYSTHELDIALQLSDRVMLIHPKGLLTLPVEEMRYRPELPQLFSNDQVHFDPTTGQVTLT